MASEGVDRRRLVVFVCTHGAVRSRVAAAFFKEMAPPGWSATSVGLEPQPELGETARQLLLETRAAPWLEMDPPRGMDLFASADRTVAIDCEVAGADRWQLRNGEFGPLMVEELRRLAVGLAAEIAASLDC